MRTTLRELLLGRPHTRPATARDREKEAPLLWQPPAKFPSQTGRTYAIGCPPGWKLCIKVHEKPDQLPRPHYHGGRLLSFILAGGYHEERVEADGWRHHVYHRRWTFNWLPTGTAHTITRHPKGRSITLLLVFPSVQSPGYRDAGVFKSFGRWSYENAAVTADA